MTTVARAEKPIRAKAAAHRARPRVGENMGNGAAGVEGAVLLAVDGENGDTLRRSRRETTGADLNSLRLARRPRPAKPSPVANSPSPAPTLRSIARAAGVSLGTVSLALRNNPQTARATRARVQAIAARLGYRPDPQVAKLMSYLQQRRRRPRAGALAYVTAFAERDVWRESSTWTSYFEGAAAQAESLGYRLEHFWLRAAGMSEQRLSRILHHRGIEGLLIAPVPRTQRRMTLEWPRFSTVAFGYSLHEPRVHRVVHNHFHTMSMATAELRARGYERIGLVIGPDH